MQFKVVFIFISLLLVINLNGSFMSDEELSKTSPSSLSMSDEEVSHDDNMGLVTPSKPRDCFFSSRKYMSPAEVLEDRLREAARKGDVREVKRLLKQKDKFDINGQDIAGHTALQIASEADNIQMIEILLENGAHPDIKENFGETARDNSPLNWQKLCYQAQLRANQKIRELEVLKKTPKNRLMAKLTSIFMEATLVGRAIQFNGDPLKIDKKYQKYSVQELADLHEDLIDQGDLIKNCLSQELIEKVREFVYKKLAENKAKKNIY